MSTFNRNVPHLIRRCAQAAFCFALLLQTAVAQPCASLPSRAQLKTMDVNRLGAVALQGWLTCGWAAAEPVMRRWRVAAHAAWLQEQRAEGAFFDKHEQLRDNAFAMGLALLVFVNPSEIDSVLEDYFEEIDREERSTAAATWKMDADVETRLRHFEAGLPQAIALLRRDVSRSPGAALELDLALVKYEVRQDRIDAARALLDRAEAVWRAREQDWSVKASHQLRIDELRKVLAPVVLQPSVPGNRGWTLDRRRDRGCGTGVFKERRYGVNYLRAYVLRTADTHLVMAERLDARWVGEVYGDSSATRELAGLLRQHRSDSELRQDWHDALASLRNDDEVVGLTFQGRFLPLPERVIEPGEAPGSMRDRRFTTPELIEIVRATPLYREWHTSD